MNKIISIVAAVLVLILGGFYFSNQNNKVETEEINTQNSYQNNNTNEVIGNTIEKEPVVSNDTGFAAVGSYEIYSPEKIAQKSTTSRVVLFFNAIWCPTCRALNTDIKINAKNISGDITILSVDYDTYKDLKKKYGVTYQHTFVQVDADGNMIKKWSGSSTLAKLVQEVQ